MQVTTTFDPRTRRAWRDWLTAHHQSDREIWLVLRSPAPGAITYLDAVEEAICFGWIDGIAKRHEGATAQRFTPRRPRSNWTELNKERARRLIRDGRMTEAGMRVLPSLDEGPIEVASDVRERFLAVAGAWEHFEAAPTLYQRVRLGYVEEMRSRDRAEWDKRLSHLIARSAKGELFGNWDDSGLPKTTD